MTETGPSARVDAVRRFNRFYTRQIGVLTDRLLQSPFSPAEARVVYELAQRETATAAELGKALGLDAGYLSRILLGFKQRGLIRRQPSAADGRESVLKLTAKGRAALATLDTRSAQQIEALLGALPAADQERLVAAMRTIQGLLCPPPAGTVPYSLRPHRPGDLGWVVQRHGALYAEEYGWNVEFEALVAGIVAEFVRHYDPERERCWIAEMNGEAVGSVFVVKQSKTVAKLRLLLVEPRARGLGIGARLVDECVRFARQAGYRKLTLWTNSVLVAARRLYEQAGFRMIAQEPHHRFGQDLVSETWELRL